MVTETDYLKLEKPERTDTVSHVRYNTNMDTIDQNAEDMHNEIELINNEFDNHVVEYNARCEQIETQIEHNAKNIASVTETVNDNAKNIASVTETVNDNAKNIASVTETVNDNAKNIASVTETVNDNTKQIGNNSLEITDLKNKVKAPILHCLSNFIISYSIPTTAGNGYGTVYVEVDINKVNGATYFVPIFLNVGYFTISISWEINTDNVLFKVFYFNNSTSSHSQVNQNTRILGFGVI